MSASAEFKEFIKDQLSGFAPVSIRNMFGGAGVYHDGLMFALIADDTLYLKADSQTSPDFAAEGLKPFEYMGKAEKRMVMAYWRAPEPCLDDPAEMTDWAQKAFAAALRAMPKRHASR